MMLECLFVGKFIEINIRDHRIRKKKKNFDLLSDL